MTVLCQTYIYIFRYFEIHDNNMYIMVSGAIARTGFYWGCPNTVSSSGSRGRSHVVQTMFRMDLKMSIGLNRFLLGLSGRLRILQMAKWQVAAW